MARHPNSIKSKILAAIDALGPDARPTAIAAAVGAVDQFINGRWVNALPSRAYILNARREWLKINRITANRCGDCAAWRRYVVREGEVENNEGICGLRPPVYIGPMKQIDDGDRPHFVDAEYWQQPATDENGGCFEGFKPKGKA